MCYDTGRRMMTRGLKWIVPLVLSFMAAGCGDTLYSEEPVGDPTSLVGTVTLVADPETIGTSPAATSQITAIVRDAANRALADEVVQFSADSGVLSNIQMTTNAEGLAYATLSPGEDASIRTITVTAVAGNVTATKVVTLSGTTISVSGAANASLGVPTALTITLRDSAGAAIPGATVTVSSAQNNELNPTTATTNSSGQASVTFTALSGGDHTITASAMGATGSHTLTVSSQTFSVTMAPVVAIDTCEPISVSWADALGPVSGTVTFAATRGTLYIDAGCTAAANQITTSAAGTGTIYIKSPNTGPTTVNATAADVFAEAYSEFVANTPHSLVFQASSTTLGLEDSVTLTATVRDVNDNLVKGATVVFAIVTDMTGGSLSPAYAVTDSLGRASTVYSSTTVTSELNGIEILASVQGAPAINDNVLLTVGGAAMTISLGMASAIESLNVSTYHYQGSVQVADANSNPVSGALVTLKLVPESYDKGERRLLDSYWTAWSTVGATWASNVYVNNGFLSCLNEDLDLDGVLDAGEDYNGNGQLDPGKPATITTTVTTDSNGNATFYVDYPKDYASWLQVRIIASIVVSGTESSNSLRTVLPAVREEVKNDKLPPGMYSPFGTAISCADPT